MKEKIEIQRSNLKKIFAALGSLIFIAIGLMLGMSPEKFDANPDTLQKVGGVMILLFGFCLVFIVRSIMTKDNIGFIIDEKGITDRTTITSIGLIEWEDILGLHIVDVTSTKILVPVLKNTDKYINKSTSESQKEALEVNCDRFGFPVAFTAHALQITYDDLADMISQELKERGVQNYLPIKKSFMSNEGL